MSLSNQRDTMTVVSHKTDADDVTVKRDEYVEIRFGDGHICRFDLLELRLNCPCAECRGVREAGDEAWPRPGSPSPLRIEGAELVGAWGLGLAWNDGHTTGIYPWEALRRWCDAGAGHRSPTGGG
jgi:DUF971 family protein